MRSSHGVILYLTLLLALLSDASEDSQLLQRDVTDMQVDGDDSGLQREITYEDFKHDMLQRPITPKLSKIMAAGSSDMTQREDTNFHPESVPIGQPVFGPRSTGPDMGPVVRFPPSSPNTGNLQEICRFSNAPVQYPKEMFPLSGFGHAVRQGEIMNELQSWYGVCCGIKGTQEEQICCAEQAWKKSLSAYCSSEFSIKTSHYFCCKKYGQARWSCFDREASDSSYHIFSEVSNGNAPQKSQSFIYNPSACKK